MRGTWFFIRQLRHSALVDYGDAHDAEAGELEQA
jgi:hypothetical protein